MAEIFSFEEALKRLEEIAAKLEADTAPLDESLKLYEEGAKLAAQCSAVLKNAQQRITELSVTEED